MVDSPDCLLRGDLLDVRQLPHLVEEFLLRTVEAEHELELTRGSYRNPVDSCRRGCRSSVEIDNEPSEFFLTSAAFEARLAQFIFLTSACVSRS